MPIDIAKYQTLIGASLGFTGVIITLFTNAWLSRRAAAGRRRQESVALLAAFYAELGSAQAIIGEANVYMAGESQGYVTRTPSTVESSYCFQAAPRKIFEANWD